MGARLRPGGEYGVYGNTMAPGFVLMDFEGASSDALIAKWPQRSGDDSGPDAPLGWLKSRRLTIANQCRRMAPLRPGGRNRRGCRSLSPRTSLLTPLTEEDCRVAFKAVGMRGRTPGAEQGASPRELGALAFAALALALLAIAGLASSVSPWHANPAAASAPTTALRGLASAGGVVLVIALLLLWVGTPTARRSKRKTTNDCGR